MNVMHHIRTEVFGVSQVEFAGIAGVTQATVSRWESGKWEPSRGELARIRSEAISRGLSWTDGLFFLTHDGVRIPRGDAA